MAAAEGDHRDGGARHHAEHQGPSIPADWFARLSRETQATTDAREGAQSIASFIYGGLNERSTPSIPADHAPTHRRHQADLAGR